MRLAVGCPPCELTQRRRVVLDEFEAAPSAGVSVVGVSEGDRPHRVRRAVEVGERLVHQEERQRGASPRLLDAGVGFRGGDPMGAVVHDEQELEAPGRRLQAEEPRTGGQIGEGVGHIVLQIVGAESGRLAP